jgi:diguanylate cyclase (GGDEF)-like protein
MSPGPLRREDLPTSITRLYFRLLVPLLAGVIAWTMWALPANRPTLVFAGLLLLIAAAHRLLTRWEWLLRTLLFSDRPRVGRVLSLTFAVAATLLVVRWNGPRPGPGTAALLLGVCLTTDLFGWAVVGLQRRLLLGERDARRDSLTGLLNRRAFEEACAALTRPGLLAVLDLDHFKRINDRYGHEAGDRVLRAVADVLLDTVAGCGEVYRWGGEEFVVCVPGDCGVDAHALLERVRREVAARSFVGGEHVTLSIGTGTTRPGRTLREAFAHADAALRAAKDSGRDRIVRAPAA